MPRPHVVMDALQVTTQPAGVARAILEYLAEMSGTDRGFKFTVLTGYPEVFGFLEGRAHWTIRRCSEARGSAGQKAIFTQWGVPRLLSEIKADLLHSMQFITPLRSPCPTVATVHDMVWRLHPETIEQPRRSYYRWLVPRSLRAAAAILTNSESTARDVRRCLPGVAERVYVTPFGTPTWLAPTEGVVVRDQGYGERPFFLFVGTLEPRKNLPMLLAAFADFLDNLVRQGVKGASRPRLVLVGSPGWKMKELRCLLDGFSHPGHLEIRDYLPEVELARLYHTALALVFPSLYEGFGFPVLEAMSVGLPVMTADRGALAEVSGDAALLVDPLDQGQMVRTLHRLHAEVGLRRTLALAGLRRQSHWNWARTVAETLPVYRRVVARSQGGDDSGK